MSFDSIRDSPEAKLTIQIYFCTPTVQLLLLCLHMSFDSIRDSPEAKLTIQIYFCTPTVQLLLLCLRTVQIT